MSRLLLLVLLLVLLLLLLLLLLLDGNMSRCNSGGPSDFSFPSGRVGHVMPGFTMSSDISNLPKVSSSPGGATSQQRQTAVRNDRSMEPVQVSKFVAF